MFTYIRKHMFVNYIILHYIMFTVKLDTINMIKTPDYLYLNEEIDFTNL